MRMLGPRPYNPGPYDDDWEDQPAQSGFHKWFLGVAVPLGLVAYGVWVLATGEASMQGRGMSAVLRGVNADAYGLAAMSLGVFMHCHYFWGNIYDQIWFAVLGKIVSGIGFVGSLGFLIVHFGVCGRN